jgi:hypothetical protein
MKLAIELSPEQEKQLTEAALRLNIPVEALAAAAVRDLVAFPASEFEAAADELLKKNRELYERLS